MPAAPRRPWDVWATPTLHQSVLLVCGSGFVVGLGFEGFGVGFVLVAVFWGWFDAASADFLCAGGAGAGPFARAFRLGEFEIVDGGLELSAALDGSG